MTEGKEQPVSEMVERVKGRIRFAIWGLDYEGAFWAREIDMAARAAIAAMREPTEEMLEVWSSDDLACWRMRIDAALGAPPDAIPAPVEAVLPSAGTVPSPAPEIAAQPQISGPTRDPAPDPACASCDPIGEGKT